MQSQENLYLYHGSTTPDLTVLVPSKRYEPQGVHQTVVYATPLPAYAAAHGFPWDSTEGFDTRIENGVVVLVVPQIKKDRLRVPVYIYQVPVDTFVYSKDEDSGYTWQSKEPVYVIGVEKYGSVVEAMEKLGGRIEYVN